MTSNRPNPLKIAQKTQALLNAPLAELLGDTPTRTLISDLDMGKMLTTEAELNEFNMHIRHDDDGMIREQRLARIKSPPERPPQDYTVRDYLHAFLASDHKLPINSPDGLEAFKSLNDRVKQNIAAHAARYSLDERDAEEVKLKREQQQAEYIAALEGLDTLANKRPLSAAQKAAMPSFMDQMDSFVKLFTPLPLREGQREAAAKKAQQRRETAKGKIIYDAILDGNKDRIPDYVPDELKQRAKETGYEKPEFEGIIRKLGSLAHQHGDITDDDDMALQMTSAMMSRDEDAHRILLPKIIDALQDIQKDLGTNKGQAGGLG